MECSGENVENSSLDEARREIRELREKFRAQSQQLMAWRHRAKMQEEAVARIAHERSEQLRTLSAQLLLFEARLCRRQKALRDLLSSREALATHQQRVIRRLRARLLEAGIDPRADEDDDEDEEEDNRRRLEESTNDSDSAVILEDGSEAPQSSVSMSSVGQDPPSLRVARSISDAVDQSRYAALKKMRSVSTPIGGNGLLRRPEVLETVYSVEEDVDDDPQMQQTTSLDGQPGDGSGGDHNDGGSRESENGDDGDENEDRNEGKTDPRRLALYGSFERLSGAGLTQVAYNRVMSNHRSVTKPRDVKYRRINKAKSKSLEELRGRLRGGGHAPPLQQASSTAPFSKHMEQRTA